MLALLWRLGALKAKEPRHPVGMPVARLECPQCLGRSCPACGGKTWDLFDDPAEIVQRWASSIVDLWFLCGGDDARHWPSTGGVLDQTAWWMDAKLYLDAILRKYRRDQAEKERRRKK